MKKEIMRLTETMSFIVNLGVLLVLFMALIALYIMTASLSLPLTGESLLKYSIFFISILFVVNGGLLFVRAVSFVFNKDSIANSKQYLITLLIQALCQIILAGVLIWIEFLL